MIFHWSLSDSKFPLISSTLLSILGNLNNTVVWIVSIHPPLETVPSMSITTGTIIILMFHDFFSSRARSKYWSLFALSLIFTVWSTRTAKSTIWQVFFFYKSSLGWSSGQDQVIRLYLKILENFMYLILYDGFWFVHI